MLMSGRMSYASLGSQIATQVRQHLHRIQTDPGGKGTRDQHLPRRRGEHREGGFGRKIAALASGKQGSDRKLERVCLEKWAATGEVPAILKCRVTRYSPVREPGFCSTYN